MTDIKGLYPLLGYEFHDQELLRLALSHRSAGRENNERLEFLGDAILGFIISEYLYSELPRASEGDLSRYRASLVKKSTLAAVARGLRIGEYLILGAGELKSGGKRRESILADSVEAIISAIYQDGGLEACRRVVLHWYRDRLTVLEPGDTRKDAKTRLQEHLQGKRQALPVYEVIDISGRDHDQVFSVSCRVSSLSLETGGKGSSRREAEQQAARLALISLGAEHNE